MESAYYIAFKIVESNKEGESSIGDNRAMLCKRIWHINIPEKIKIFAWRACVNGLPIVANLQARGINREMLCHYCDRELESISHALIRCDIVKRVWSCWEGCLVKAQVV